MRTLAAVAEAPGHYDPPFCYCCLAFMLATRSSLGLRGSGTVGSGAERMRRHRYLRKVGVRFTPVHLYEDEITALVACGLLDASERQNPTAVAVALGQYLDRNTIQAI